VSGVFDWGCALYGDFLYDLAWLTFWRRGTRPRRSRSRAGGAPALRRDRLVVPDLAARLRCYEVHIGLAHLAFHSFTQEWDHLEWPSAGSSGPGERHAVSTIGLTMRVPHLSPRGYQRVTLVARSCSR